MSTSTASATRSTLSGLGNLTVTVSTVYNIADDTFTDTVSTSTDVAMSPDPLLVDQLAVLAANEAHKKARAQASTLVAADLKASYRFGDASIGADGELEASPTDTQRVLSTNWLNAYNAPHWMDIGSQMQFTEMKKQTGYTIPGWNNKQDGSRGTNVESYGVSWMRDLMVAKQYAPSKLVQSASWFNGSVDANLGQTPKYVKGGPGLHLSHDLGMAFDLGVSNYIGPVAQSSQNEHLTIGKNDLVDPKVPAKGTVYSNVPDKNAYDNNLWSYDNAIYLTELLPNIVGTPTTSGNDQVSALRDALSLYAEVRSSTWSTLKIVSGNNADEQARVRAALFGDGTAGGALISKILIGDLENLKNTYPNIREILQRLGIADGLDLQHHFHLYLNPPAAVAIDATHNLLSDVALANTAAPDAMLQTEVQSLFDYAQTLTHTGDELMFIMDVPYAPAQQTPIVLAQAATPGSGATQQPDYILKQCQETESTGDPRSAMRSVDPAGWLAVYIGNRDHRVIYSNPAALASIRTTLLEGTTHGEISSVVDNTGRSWYRYDAVPEYVGKDRAVFMAEFEGKRYKIVLDLRVFIGVDENNPTCPPPQLIKVNGKPVSGSYSYDLNTISVTYADLPYGAVGQTVGEGANATITLDDNAAGNGWFIDSTPGDNSEFLPTSNPYEWVAKEGSAAYGKMDMLSVLLHEYGHALGIDHSADGHDYMATTLTAGVRRLPSVEELALMQQLISGVKTEMASVSTPGSGNTPSQLPLLPLGGFGLAFLGRLRGTRYGSLNVEADLSTLVTQFAVTANAKLTNGNFSVASGMPVDNGWTTQGGVDFANGTATLKEVSTSQTRLNQVFVWSTRVTAS